MQGAMGASPRVGTMAVGLAAYWPQFRECASKVLGAHSQAERAIRWPRRGCRCRSRRFGRYCAECR